MERSAIKGMSLLTLNESETKKTRPRKRDIGRIRVRGYNTDLHHDDVVNALRKHFSSCGEITDVCVHVLDDNILNRFVSTSSSNSTQVLYNANNFGFVLFHSCGLIYFLGGQGTVIDKALQLSGIDVGGWTVMAEPYPFWERAGWYPVAVVQGYDTLLDNADIEKMLFEHFSSCGEVTEIRIHKRSIGAAVVELYGEGAEDRVLDLDGSYMGGCKILVKLIIPSKGIHTVHPRRRYYGWPR
ncbi:hypothetical protein Bca52824_070024 [Brassica carinata]|uniref:RRM domain-containing protein n=1 Tax=Brassica carinata TaxID=52824 RepID=A0A8X7Q5Z3_BRACI|nr:hypothetical protein Bca52824_070024 [Brassica carinata]